MQSGCQQHEPTEASQQNIANRSRNSLRSRREGRQKKQEAIDGKKYYIMIDYNQSIVEQIIQMGNENWAHFFGFF